MPLFNEHWHKLAPYCAGPSRNEDVQNSSSFLCAVERYFTVCCAVTPNV